MQDLLSRVSGRELAEWEAYYRLEAEDERKHVLAAKVAADVQRGRKGRMR